MSESPRSRAMLMNVATVVVIALAFVLMLRQPLSAYNDARRAKVGAKPFTSADSVSTLTGAALPLLAKDSLTMAVFLGPNCARCRKEAGDYAAMAHWAALQGVALRLVSPDKATTAELAKGAANDTAFVTAPAAVFDRLRLRHRPTVLFIDTAGVVMSRTSGWVPERLGILNRMNGVLNLP